MKCSKCGSDDLGEIITYHCFNCAREFTALEMAKANREEPVKEGKA